MTNRSARKAKRSLKGQGWSSTQEVKARRKMVVGKPDVWCPIWGVGSAVGPGRSGARQRGLEAKGLRKHEGTHPCARTGDQIRICAIIRPFAQFCDVRNKVSI